MKNLLFDYSSEIREETLFVCECDTLPHFEKVVSSILVDDKICKIKISNNEFIYEFMSYPIVSPYSYEKLSDTFSIETKYDFKISTYSKFGKKIKEQILSLTLKNINNTNPDTYSILEFTND